MTCVLQTEHNRFGLNVAKDAHDVERLTRLKELAETNKHLTLALAFHADEMRAKRWQSNTSTLSSTLDLVFDKLCNYGQSVLRPFFFWLLSISVFTLLYARASDKFRITFGNVWEMFVFSVANSLPFLTSARTARSEGLTHFFTGQDILTWILPLMMAQGLVSFMLLFLIGLGLRNRFRL